MNKRSLGSNYERLAEEYLKEHGVIIAARNFRTKQGEIDLIGYDGKYLVFFEVKYRTTGQFGNPEEAVTLKKQRTICRVANVYRFYQEIGENIPIRYDVITVLSEEILWYRNAFSHIS